MDATKGVRMVWMWHNNDWVLGIKLEGGKFQPVILGTHQPSEWESHVIEGPIAGIISPAPEGTPKWPR
jgi:hypothetical protein